MTSKFSALVIYLLLIFFSPQAQSFFCSSVFGTGSILPIWTLVSPVHPDVRNVIARAKQEQDQWRRNFILTEYVETVDFGLTTREVIRLANATTNYYHYSKVIRLNFERQLPVLSVAEAVQLLNKLYDQGTKNLLVQEYVEYHFKELPEKKKQRLMRFAEDLDFQRKL